MRKLSFLLIGLMAGILLLPSCDTTEDEILGPPTLDLKGEADFVSTDATIETGTLFKVGVAATSNTESNKKLTTLQLTRTMDNTVFVDTTYTINDTYFNADFTFNAQQDGQVEVILFSLIDDAGKTASKSISITYETIGSAVAKNTDILLGSYNDDIGSFYSTVNLEVYDVVEAYDKMADIDFLFYLGVNDSSTIASPANGTAGSVFPAVAHWSIRNETLFATTAITVEEFENIGDTYEFPEFAGDQSSITQLVTGDVVIFKTVGEKLGLIKVNSINGRGDQILIDVIISE